MRPDFDFRRCSDCSARYARTLTSCPTCGRYGVSLNEVLEGPQLLVVGSPFLIATLLAFVLPVGRYAESGLIAAGLTPLLFVISRYLWHRRQRSSDSYYARIERLEHRLEELEHDLAATERRLMAAQDELGEADSDRAARAIRRELDQDERLRRAQRRLTLEIEDRLERLQIEQLKNELLYYEACRDARVEETAAAEELERRIERLEDGLEDNPGLRWEQAIEDVRSLHRQLSRGVERFHAAARLDPLAHADLGADDEDLEPAFDIGGLEDQTDLHLERIDRGFDALDELTADLAVDPDASGVRLRVDDDVIAQLEAEEAAVEEAPKKRKPGRRTSVV